MNRPFIVGIDASNLRIGGGVTHLIEFIRNIDYKSNNDIKLIIWGYEKTLSKISSLPVIEKHPLNKDYGLFQKVYWQLIKLPREAKKSNCDIIFVPGGNYIGFFRPFITMSRNMLPFELGELQRYGFSMMTLKLLLLRLFQSFSMRRANGVIFLTNYALHTVSKIVGGFQGDIRVIPHGVNKNFFNKNKDQYPIEQYNEENPYEIVYVSIIDVYKHQWIVAEAVNILKKKSYPVKLSLIGPKVKFAYEKLTRKLLEIENSKDFINYLGPIEYSDLPKVYQKFDLGIFASSCENMPNILVEMMASGIPIVCSKKDPMPEILGKNGNFFCPEEPEMLASIIEELMLDPTKRRDSIKFSYEKVKEYSWDRCSKETLSFIREVSENYVKKT